MARMFQLCSNLTSLDLSGFDTGSVRNMNHIMPANIETVVHSVIGLYKIGDQNFFQIFLNFFDMSKTFID